MTRVDAEIPAADGRASGTLHVPSGDGPWPGVLVFPDAGGYRETFREMGDHLASLGFVALIPDIFYRAGDWAPFRMTAVVYVAGAIEDASFTAEQAELLDTALAAAGVEHTIEFYPARHGFAVPDNDTYDPQGSARHWEALRHLYSSSLT